jgi:outer membrane protein assembly factor BamE (lipoprotein component of BamABCDE complex)
VKALRRAALILAAAFMTGCPMNPAYDNSHPNGRLIEPALAGGFPQIGTSTRADVLLTLGDPDVVDPGETAFTYRWTLLTHYGFGNAPLPTYYTLVIHFDPRGAVKDFTRSPPAP